MKRSIKLTGFFLCFSSKYWHSPNSENMICHHPINMSHCATSNNLKCKSKKGGACTWVTPSREVASHSEGWKGGKCRKERHLTQWKKNCTRREWSNRKTEVTGRSPNLYKISNKSPTNPQCNTAALQSPVKFHGTQLGQELHSNARKLSKNLVFYLTRPGKRRALRWLLTPSILWELHAFQS